MVARWASHSPPPKIDLSGSRVLLLDLSLQLITPMFGGGVVAGEPDPTLPVRASAIRGNLRFWWRACVVAASPSAERLFADEGAIWGQAHRAGTRVDSPSAIEVEVSDVQFAEQSVRPCQVPHQDRNGRWHQAWTTSDPPWRWDPLGYALWPFAESKQRSQPADAVWELAFRLKLFATPGTTPARELELKQSATAAVWAWVTFGGLGARTRRGCGALRCQTDGFRPPSGQDPVQWVHEQATIHVKAGPHPLLVPALHGAQLIIGRREDDPIPAWRQAIQLMRDYRQGEGVGRNNGTRQPGRPGISRWPEPSSLRQHVPIPDPDHPVADENQRYYPRADLGLPILFQRMGVRQDITVTMAGKGRGTERMASPVIVKPLALGDGQAVPLVLLLKAPHVWDVGTPGVTLDETTDIATWDLYDPAKSTGVPPLNGRPTAREGFLAYATHVLQVPARPLTGSS